MIDLQQVTTRFSKAYDKNKQARKWLDKQQTRMFQAFDETLTEQQLAQKTVQVPDEVIAEKWLTEHYPGWVTLHVTAGDDGVYAVIQENPSLKKFRYVNPITKEVMGRDMVEGSPMLDDEALQTEDPELWEQISTWPEPWYGLVKDTIRQFVSLPWSEDAIENAADDVLRARGVKRVIMDPNDMSDYELSAIQPFITPGKVSVRLSPPREAKEEELDNA